MPKSFGTWLIIGGIVLVLLGVLANSGWLSWFGRLPGDIRIERDHVRFYLLIFYFIGKFWK